MHGRTDGYGQNYIPPPSAADKKAKQMFLLFSVRQLNKHLFGKIAIHSVYHACLSLTFVNSCQCIFPFWVSGRY